MYLVKYLIKATGEVIYRRYKNRTEGQVRAIANAAFKKGWVWVSITKEY